MCAFPKNFEEKTQFPPLISHFPVHPTRYLSYKMWTVYVLKCSDGSFYTGCTNNLEDRINRHNKGQIAYTSTRQPVELVVYFVFKDKYRAYEFENYLKSGSGHAFMFKRLVNR